MKSLTTSQAARGAWALASGAVVIVLAAGTASAATTDHVPDHHGRHPHLLRHEASHRPEHRLEEHRLEERRLEERRLEHRRLEERRLEERRLEERRLERHRGLHRLEHSRLQERHLTHHLGYLHLHQSVQVRPVMR
ncbi:MAG: hypothetical protein JO362_13385 [Streptomycetaceae bacterium]|nr:hypothetical protein [Streptomycetaceae bacterium]